MLGERPTGKALRMIRTAINVGNGDVSFGLFTATPNACRPRADIRYMSVIRLMIECAKHLCCFCALIAVLVVSVVFARE